MTTDNATAYMQIFTKSCDTFNLLHITLLHPYTIFISSSQRQERKSKYDIIYLQRFNLVDLAFRNIWIFKLNTLTYNNNLQLTIVVFDRSSEYFQHPNGEMRFLTFDGHSSDGDDTQDGTNSWEDIDLQEESI